MAFSTRISGGDFSVMFYLTVSGLPYVWSNQPVPSDWDAAGSSTVTIDGETYTWSSTLKSSALSSIRRELDPWRGIAESGALGFEMQVTGTNSAASDDYLLGLLSPSLTRGEVTRLAQTLSPTETSTAHFDDVTDFVSAGDAYISTETIGHTGKGSTTLLTLTRGKYGSRQRIHIADVDEIIETGAGGAYTTQNRALVLKGRVATLWCAPGSVDEDGTFVPYSSAPQGSEDRQVWRGIVRKGKPKGVAEHMHLRCRSLPTLLQDTIYNRAPRARAGHGESPASAIQIDDSCNRLSWHWDYRGDSPASRVQPSVENQPLLDGDAADGTELADGVYPLGELAAHLDYTIKNPTVTISGGGSTGHPFSSGNQSIQLSSGVNDDGATVVTVGFITDTTDSFDDDYVWELDYGPRTFWRRLGFEESQQVTTQSLGSSGDVWFLRAGRGLPAFYLPAPSEQPATRKLYYHNATGPDFDESPGWTDDEGAAIDGYALVGEEIVRFTGTGSDTIGARSVKYLSVVERGLFGTVPAEQYIEQNDDTDFVELKQVIAWPDTSWGRMFVQMATSGSGVDQSNGDHDHGWRDSGAYVWSDLVDADAIIGLAEQSYGKRDNWCITDQMTLADLVESESLLSQVGIVDKYDSTNGYRLSAVDLGPPLEGQTAAAALDHSSVDSTGLAFDVDDDRVVSTITAQDIAYNNGTGEGREIPWRNATAAGTWGRGEAFVVSLRGVSGYQAGISRLQDLAQAHTAMYGAPFLVLDVPVTRASKVWLVELGDQVTLTNEALPSQSTVGRGVTSLDCRVLSKTDYYGPRADVAGVMTLVAAGLGNRFAEWAPSCRLTSSLSSVRFNSEAYYYGQEDEGFDSARFADGWRVDLHEAGDWSTKVTRTIDNVSGQIVEFTVAPSLTPPIIMTLASYDDGSITDTDQHKFAYYSDGDGKLDKSSGSDDPILWS